MADIIIFMTGLIGLWSCKRCNETHYNSFCVRVNNFHSFCVDSAASGLSNGERKRNKKTR